MENLEFDIFNLDNEAFVKQEIKKDEDEFIYKPYPELGKDGVYKSLVRFLPNITNPKKSKIHQYYVWLKDPVDGTNHKAICPSTVGKKSILKDLFWKLKNSPSAKDQEISKSFSRKEDFYSLIQVVKDANRPDLEGKIMIFKFGRKVNDLIEQQIKPEFGNPSNPYDLFEGKNFGIQVRKVGEWNNYDLCSFVGDKCAIEIDGRKMEKNPGDMKTITDYLEGGPKNLTSFDYKDWDDALTERVMGVIKNTVPDGRLVNEIMSGVNTSTSSKPAQAPTSSSSLYEEASSTKVGSEPVSQSAGINRPSAPTTASSLDDLYADL